jgi:hypothetical protein
VIVDRDSVCAILGIYARNKMDLVNYQWIDKIVAGLIFCSVTISIVSLVNEPNCGSVRATLSESVRDLIPKSEAL